MINKREKEYLDDVLTVGSTIFQGEIFIKWYTDSDVVMKVARILDDAGIFKTTAEVITFFDMPESWERSIRNLIKE